MTCNMNGKRNNLTLLGICLLVISLSLYGLHVEEKEDIQKTLKFQDPSKPKEVKIDNIFGSIDVMGYNGQEVKLLVHKTIKGRSKEIIQKAREEVKLDITEEGNTIDIYVDGPFRCDCKSKKSRNWRNPGYEVNFDFKLKVPHKTSLYLRTVNKGAIRVENVEGDFEVRNVNGEIEMREIGGSGKAHTVNGKVTVIFSKNPESECSFRTVNGTLKTSFLKNLSADLRLKTFNGDVYSDFSVTHLPASPPIHKRFKGKYIYKSSRFFGVRVGKGGAEIKLDTFNGDIFISKRK
ncbi:MAG: DUF4097 domain-containing protein [Candidatus Aminicenantaceae bacterium]